MNLYRIYRTDKFILDCTQYISAVIVADNEEEARKIHPAYGKIEWWTDEWRKTHTLYPQNWPRILDYINVEHIGIADPNLKIGDIICHEYMVEN